MKLDPTTFAGMVGGAALAVAALPGLPKAVTTVASIVGAASVGALGWHATACPANCPGTNAAGLRLPAAPPSVRRVIPVACFLALVAALAIVLLTGCTAVRVSTSRSVEPGSTNTVEKTALTGFSLFDSSQAIAKASAHSGYATNGTWSPGLTMSDLTQTSSSTGMVLIIQNILPAAVSAAAK